MPVFLLLTLITGTLWGKSLELVIEGQGLIGYDREFRSLGTSVVADAPALLKPHGGYQLLYNEFKTRQGTTGKLWQDAIRFQQYIEQNYVQSAPAEILATQMALDAIFSSQDDAEIPPVLNELSRHLSFEQKVAFGSQLGGILLAGYDEARAKDTKTPVVSFRDMINAKKNGEKAGVCRDISVAVASSLSEMGLKNTFIVAYLSTQSGHTTVLVQDPDNVNKTYTLNYDYVTSNESASSATHLLQDSTLPDTSIQYDIYDAQGKILTVFPSNLGIALKELAGGHVTDLDPMAKSENSMLKVAIGKVRGFDAAAGISQTPNGDTLMAFTAGYTLDSERVPGRYAVVVYSNERDSVRGRLQQKGVYFSATQKVQSKPWIIPTRNGEVRTRVTGKIDYNVQALAYFDQTDSVEENYVLTRSNSSLRSGIETSYKSTDGKTVIEGSLTAAGSLGKSDVRDQVSMITPYGRDMTAHIFAGHVLAQGLEGFLQATLTVRDNQLGSQARTEAGFRYKWGNNEVSLVAGREGKVTGPTLAFVPGSLEKYYAEITGTFQKRFRANAGVYCAKNVKNCSLKAGGAFVLPLR